MVNFNISICLQDEKKKQMVTFNKDLLMAFVYFDQSHCGYLQEKDLEEIMYTLGLHLSRAQVLLLWSISHLLLTWEGLMRNFGKFVKFQVLEIWKVPVIYSL